MPYPAGWIFNKPDNLNVRLWNEFLNELDVWWFICVLITVAILVVVYLAWVSQPVRNLDAVFQLRTPFYTPLVGGAILDGVIAAWLSHRTLHVITSSGSLSTLDTMIWSVLSAGVFCIGFWFASRFAVGFSPKVRYAVPPFPRANP